MPISAGSLGALAGADLRRRDVVKLLIGQEFAFVALDTIGFSPEQFETPALGFVQREIIAPQAQIGQFVEAVIDPTEQDVVRGDAFEARTDIDIAMDESLNLADELGLAAIFFRLRRQQDHLVADEVVVGRVGD